MFLDTEDAPLHDLRRPPRRLPRIPRQAPLRLLRLPEVGAEASGGRGVHSAAEGVDRAVESRASGIAAAATRVLTPHAMTPPPCYLQHASPPHLASARRRTRSRRQDQFTEAGLGQLRDGSLHRPRREGRADHRPDSRRKSRCSSTGRRSRRTCSSCRCNAPVSWTILLDGSGSMGLAGKIDAAKAAINALTARRKRRRRLRALRLRFAGARERARPVHGEPRRDHARARRRQAVGQDRFLRCARGDAGAQRARAQSVARDHPAQRRHRQRLDG